MLHINKHLFYDICDKNIDIYNDIIDTTRTDYNNTINEIRVTTDCKQLRLYIHKIICIVIFYKDTNNECIYICRSILQMSNSNTDINVYKYWINLLLELDKQKIGI